MSENTCTHAIGIATVEYYPDVIHVGDRVMEYQHFDGWGFCPYCGIDASEYVAEMHRQIAKNEDEWEKKYGSRLGC